MAAAGVVIALMLELGRSLPQEQIMNAYHFDFCGTRCSALPSGALHLPAHNMLCVSDLHLGQIRTDRTAQRCDVAAL